MMGEAVEGAEAKHAVREWIARNRIPFELIEDTRPGAALTLVERLTEKRLRFAIDQVVRAEEARQDSGSLYLRVALDDGRSFALSPMGLFFAPSFASTGPVPDCPPAACFLDYAKLFRHLEHLASETHEEHHKEALQVLMVLLAFLEGARLLGLDVSEEERELEPIVERLEKR